EDHILPECVAYTALLQKVYRDFGFTDIVYKIATRPVKRIGSDESWDKAERALIEALERSGVKFDMLPGEGAFYGPKIEYQLADRLRGAGLRVAADLRNEKISYKIREHSLQKLPYQLVVGDKEMQASAVAVRTRSGEDLGAMPVDQLLGRLQSEMLLGSTAGA